MVIRNGKLFLYADDTVLVTSASDLYTAHLNLQNDLDNVANWCKGLVINYGEGGATKWENRGSETFCATPSRQGKTFRAPPFKEWKV